MPVFTGRCPMPHRVDAGGNLVPLVGCPICSGTDTIAIPVEESGPRVGTFTWPATAMEMNRYTMGFDVSEVGRDHSVASLVRIRPDGTTMVVGTTRLVRGADPSREGRISDPKIRQSMYSHYAILGPLVRSRLFAHSEIARRGEARAFEDVGVMIEDHPPFTGELAITADIGRLIDNHVHREGVGERVRIFRELGEYLKPWCPEAANALLSYDGER
jgi:hypothetical protein